APPAEEGTGGGREERVEYDRDGAAREGEVWEKSEPWDAAAVVMASEQAQESAVNLFNEYFVCQGRPRAAKRHREAVDGSGCGQANAGRGEIGARPAARSINLELARRAHQASTCASTASIETLASASTE
ncbi:hypothetical protein TARUN_9189, partial [Trichoderma arundinaceum]